MARLRELFEALGFEDVETYVQSGNVVFRGGDADGDAAGRIERALAAKLGLDAAVLLRSSAELAAVLDGNPFLAEEDDPAKLHVVFLEREPAGAAESPIDPNRSPPDRFALRGRELYLHLPSGAGRSKLTVDYVERCLGVRATARNWRTVTKLRVLTLDP